MIDEIAFDERGLAPCVIQDAGTGEVLTLAWVNAESLRADDRDRGDAPLEPLPRRALAQGGDLGQRPARSRAPLRLRRRRRAGARRPGRPRLPHRRADLLLPRRRRRARDRSPTRRCRRSSGRSPRAATSAPEGSYTRELLADPELIGEKVREEADEVARAVAGESDERVAEEAADLLYHLEVALASRGPRDRRRLRRPQRAPRADAAERLSPTRDDTRAGPRARRARATSSRSSRRSSRTPRRRSPPS